MENLQLSVVLCPISRLRKDMICRVLLSISVLYARPMLRGLVPFYWDRGDGVFDRKNLQVYDELEYNGLMEGIK